jgi:hypothetical protein
MESEDAARSGGFGRRQMRRLKRRARSGGSANATLEIAGHRSPIEHSSAMKGAPHHPQLARWVRPRGLAPYFIEVKYGYSDEAVLASLGRKFGQAQAPVGDPSRIVVMLNRKGRSDWERLLGDLAQVLANGLKLEVWDEERLLIMLRTHFGVDITAIVTEQLLDVRQAIDHGDDCRPLFVLELCPRHSERRHHAREPHRILFQSALPDH